MRRITKNKSVVTDMIVMGTVYQHREARRILEHAHQLKPFIDAISTAIENSDEVTR